MRSGALARSEAVAQGPIVVANRYEVIGEIARGGCGAVYEAIDLDHGRLVALKILTTGTMDRAAAARFERESRVAGAIHHPNVCAVTDSGTLEDGSPFLVMERLYGETLRDLLRAGWAASTPTRPSSSPCRCSRASRPLTRSGSSTET